MLGSQFAEKDLVERQRQSPLVSLSVDNTVRLTGHGTADNVGDAKNLSAFDAASRMAAKVSAAVLTGLRSATTALI